MDIQEQVLQLEIPPEQNKDELLSVLIAEHRNHILKLKKLRKEVKKTKEEQKRTEAVLYPLAIEMKRFNLLKIKSKKGEDENEE